MFPVLPAPERVCQPVGLEAVGARCRGGAAEGPAEHVCLQLCLDLEGRHFCWFYKTTLHCASSGREGRAVCAHTHVCTHLCAEGICMCTCVYTMSVCTMCVSVAGRGVGRRGRLAELRSILTCARLQPYLPPTLHYLLLNIFFSSRPTLISC